MISIQELKARYGVEMAALILICRAYAGIAGAKDVEEYLLSDKPDLNLLYSLITEHRIRPPVLRVLSGVNTDDGFKRKLLNDCREISLSNFETAKELLRLCKLFEQADLEVIPYKGVLYSNEFYAESGMREFTDIDYLVHQKDMKQLKDILLGLGYVEEMGSIPVNFRNNIIKYGSEENYNFYENGRRKFHVELHRTTMNLLLDSPVLMPITIFFNELRESPLLNSRVRALNPTWHFIVMITHHGVIERWHNFKYVMDLVQALKSQDLIEWKKVNEISKLYKFFDAMNIGLTIVDQLFGIKPLSPGYQPSTKYQPYLNQLLLRPLPGNNNAFYRFKVGLRMRDNFSDKLIMSRKFLYYLLIPNLADYNFMKLPTRLFFLYVFVKPIRLISIIIKAIL